GIVYPGGVTNYGFPLLWTGAVRPAYDVGGGVGGGMFPDPQRECAENQVFKSRTATNDPLVQGLADTDNDWYRSRSLITHIERIQVPIHITGAYQDEQTGPRGPAHLFEKLPRSISRRLVLTNGDHGTQTSPNVRRDRLAWIDYWMRGRNHYPGVGNLRRQFGPRNEVTSSARVLLGNKTDGTFEGIIDSNRYPLRQTRWRDLYLNSDGSMTFNRSRLREGTASWANGSRRQSYSYQAGKDNGGEFSSPNGPDELEFTYTAPRDMVIAGPMAARLEISSSAPDTELFVQLIDRAPSGEMLYLQRGMLRASHRAITTALSDRTRDRRVYRPWRPHTNPQLLTTPGEQTTYQIEIFPVGHVLRKGHELVMKVHAPPADDNDYMYIQKTLPGVNTLHIDPAKPSRLLLPQIPLRHVDRLQPASAPCSFSQMRCVK
ncbi:MAG TPA: CocE/NonD family hydrolase C-terminal non-catalytic domain-containing protein, partial [Egibacteraceae bacterium]|nr:CocE/NonD family hydrolase C-terminal non-catalytic domain-containing protein [Egibacteraceae bacterium]